uniref:Transmembrane protein 126A n=1 Tax=Eptatretus burgeri TaxID=7764 RepID=A0A8C4QSJ7_EPTBU
MESYIFARSTIFLLLKSCHLVYGELCDTAFSFFRNVFGYAHVISGALAGSVGLWSNSMFRTALNVTPFPIVSSLSCIIIPFVTTSVFYLGTITEPLIAGDLKCSICTGMRGTIVGSLVGGGYPLLLAAVTTSMLAHRYQSAPVPSPRNALPFWLKVTNSYLRCLGGGRGGCVRGLKQ